MGFSLVAFAGVLYLTSYKNFYFDEWDWVSYAGPWTIKVFLLPHNEHWSTIPILVWKLLFISVGIRSHIPYEAALLVVHVIAVLLLFTLIRRRSGDLPAFAAALTLLLLGSGATDIVWAFQIGWLGSIAFGLLAMLLLDGNPPFPRRLLIVSAALLCSLMCSSVGLAFIAAVGAELIVDRRRRRFLLGLAVPVLAFGAWFLAYGAGLPGSPGAPCPSCIPTGFFADIHRSPVSIDYIVSILGFVAHGLEASAEAALGYPNLGAIVLPILAIPIAFHWYRQGGVASWQLGMVAGILAWFALVSLGRVQKGQSGAADSHYLYVGVAFLLPLIADAARELPWGRLWRPGLIAAFVVGLLSNSLLLWENAITQTDTMRIENAELQTVEVFRGAPDMALTAGLDKTIMPQLNAGPYFAAVDDFGSPVPSVNIDMLRRLPWQAIDTVMVNIFGEALTVTADSRRPNPGGSCQIVDSSVGSTMDFRVPNGQSFSLRSSKGGDAYLYLAWLGPPTSAPVRHVLVLPETSQVIHLPDTGKPIDWTLRIRTTAIGTVQVCGAGTFLTRAVKDLYEAEPEAGKLDSGWSSVADSDATDGRAAKAALGNYAEFHNDLFGGPFVPIPGTYDVWYRVRVTSVAGTTEEMKLGLWDDAGGWVGATIYRANQVGTTYSWVKVASGVTPLQHSIHFLASFTQALATDWYVDQAVMTLAGTSGPA